jgi:hypothetical protein
MKPVNLKFRVGARLAISAAVGVDRAGVMLVAQKIESNHLKLEAGKFLSTVRAA